MLCVGGIVWGPSMEKCRSFYLDSKQNDFAEPIEGSSLPTFLSSMRQTTMSRQECDYWADVRCAKSKRRRAYAENPSSDRPRWPLSHRPPGHHSDAGGLRRRSLPGPASDRHHHAAGRLMFQVTGAFAEFERSMIRQRVHAGLKRAVDAGKQLGRPRIDPALERRIQSPIAGRQGHAQDCHRVRHWQRYGSAYQAGDGWGGPPFRKRKRGRVRRR